MKNKNVIPILISIMLVSISVILSAVSAPVFAENYPDFDPAVGPEAGSLPVSVIGNGAKEGTILIEKKNADGTYTEVGRIKEEGTESADWSTVYTGLKFDEISVPTSFDYRITQIKGSDADTDYDARVYNMRAHVIHPPKDSTIDPTQTGDYEEDDSKFAVYLELQEIGEDGKAKDEKPAQVEFENCKTLTLTRRITYTERTPDGREVYKPIDQSVRLKSSIKRDEHGNPVKDASDNYIYVWEVADDDADDHGAVATKDHPDKDREGWRPNIKEVVEWKIIDEPLNSVSDPTSPDYDPESPDFNGCGPYIINLQDTVRIRQMGEATESEGYCEVIHVVYNPKTKTVTTDEYITVKRTITYTEYTRDGKTVAKAVVQTVTLKRTRTDVVDEDGKILPGKTTYTKWSIESGDTSAVKSPVIDGWTADIETVPEWVIDLDDPQDAYVYVIYKPTEDDSDPDDPDDPDKPKDDNPIRRVIREIIETSDATTISVWIAVLAVALILFIETRRRRKRQ